MVLRGAFYGAHFVVIFGESDAQLQISPEYEVTKEEKEKGREEKMEQKEKPSRRPVLINSRIKEDRPTIAVGSYTTISFPPVIPQLTMCDKRPRDLKQGNSVASH